jgi:3',5'-cyclic AMP phosphodiesterase CpdA
VPGNHDIYVRAAARLPQLQWSDYMRGDDSAMTAFPFLRRRGPLALIGLSTAVPTAAFLATGRLGSGQLARLAETLDRCAREGLFRVVMIHHPPISTPARRLKRLVDGPDFCAVLARHGAELVIHGHDHARSLIELKGPRGTIPVVGVPSASEGPPGEHDRAGYNLYAVEGEAGAWRCKAISRGLSAGGDAVAEVGRTELVGRPGVARAAS